MKKILLVKEWFSKAKAKERKDKYYDTEVFAILEETEKAVKVITVNYGVRVYWTPKSCLELGLLEEYKGAERINENVVINENDTIESLIEKSKAKSYEEAVRAYNDIMFMFR